MPVRRDGTGRSRDIICFSIFDWWYHSHAHSDFQLMLHAAQSRKVLFVNSIGMRMPTPGTTQRPLSRILRKLSSTLKFVRRPVDTCANFVVMTPLSLPVYGSPRLRRWNARLVRLQVGLVARFLGLEKPAIMVTVPTAWEVVAPDRDRLVIYNRSDKHSAFPEADSGFIEHMEQALLRAAQHVIYVHRDLMERERGATGERAYFLDHGIDAAAFQREYPEPPDLAPIPHPRLGFFGDLSGRRLDFALIARIAEELPEAHIVLLGSAADDSVAKLSVHPNVHWLGYKDHEAIAPYVTGIDVGLMPYRDTEWVRNINPIKLKEYLAVGFPIVASDFPAVVEHADVIEIAGDDDEFMDKLRLVLELGPDELARGRESRRKLVADTGWARKTDELLEECGL